MNAANFSLSYKKWNATQKDSIITLNNSMMRSNVNSKKIKPQHSIQEECDDNLIQS